MKNSPTDQPRFICRVVRGCLALLGDTSGPEPRGPGAAHVAGCEDCRQFFGACDELAVALKRDAARERRDAPAGLEQDIMRAVRRSAAESAPAPRVARLPWLSLAGVTACAVAAVFFFRQQFISGPAEAPAPTQFVAAAEDVSPRQIWESLKPSTDAVLTGAPLQNEVDAVVADARKAVGFLALNFLPTPVKLPASDE